MVTYDALNVDVVDASEIKFPCGGSSHVADTVDRIVFDESHVLVTMSQFQTVLPRIRKISVPCQVVYLMASLPPSMHQAFEEKMLFTEPRYIHASTIRRNLQYIIKVCIGEHLVQKITTYVSACLEDQHRLRWVIVYSTTTKQYQQIAKHLKYPYYHSSSPDRADTLNRWSLGGIDVIVTTGALGVGVDNTGITDILTSMPSGYPWGVLVSKVWTEICLNHEKKISRRSTEIITW